MSSSIRWGQFLAAQHALSHREAAHVYRDCMERYAATAGLSMDRFFAAHPAASRALATLERHHTRLPSAGYAKVSLYGLQEVELQRMQRGYVYLELQEGQQSVGHGRSLHFWTARPRVGLREATVASRPDPAFCMPQGQVVTVHGIFQDLRSLWPVGDLLSRDGMMLWSAYDQPGFGASRGARRMEQPEVYIEACRRMLERARGIGIHPVTLVGYSMGGAVALMTAQLYPDLVDQLVLISPMLQPRREGMMARMAPLLTRSAEAVVAGREEPIIGGLVPREVLQALKGNDVNVRMAEATDRMAEQLRATRFTFGKRTLVIYNPNDAIVDPAGIDAVFGGVMGSGTPVELYSYERSVAEKADRRHDIYNDTAVQQRIVDFVEGGKVSDGLAVSAFRDWDRRLAAAGKHRWRGEIVDLSP